MKVLVLGASGATGRQVVGQLLERNIRARIVVRAASVFPQEFRENPEVEIVVGNISEMSETDMSSILEGCDAVVSCLGHNMTFKGLFGKPRYLVRDAVRRVCRTVKNAGDKKIKLILMNTTGFTNTGNGERTSPGEQIVNSLLRLLLPPHRDNIGAARYLIDEIRDDGRNVEWVAVRPDSLVDEADAGPYEVYGSPLRSPIFDAGKTSRINVGHFMAELLADPELWQKWRFKTPVVYNT